MTQSVVQGSEDPLVVIDHQGGSGNPALWFEQDEAAQAFMWWDQANSLLNLGTPATNPIVSIQSNGTTTVQGSADPLLVINHQGGSGNPSIWFEQDGAPIAFVWCDPPTGSLNVGTAAGANPLATFPPSGTANINGSLNVVGDVFAAAFIQASSRETKENIVELRSQEALEVLEHLSPMKFNYKEDTKSARVGFIAEDVPASVASSDGKGVSFTDIVAILTQVVKEQQRRIDSLVEKSNLLELAMDGMNR